MTPEQTTGLIIRGRVTRDGIGAPDVNIYRTFASYPGQLVATTDANGYYVSDFWSIPSDEMVTVWAVQQGYVFDPPNYFWRHYHSREDRTLNFTASYAVTATPLPDVWPTYTNTSYGFKFKYPNGGEVVPGGNVNRTRINLPFQSDTNLVEKYMNVMVVENANPCRSTLAAESMLSSSENITVNGIQFLKESGGDSATSNNYKWVAYSTLRGKACISLEFVLHSVTLGVYATPPPTYNEPGEKTIFYDIVTHFAWLEPIITPSPTPVSNPLPDLTITAMRYELQNPGCLLPGDMTGLKVWVTNQGSAAATSFMVQANEAQVPVSGLGKGMAVRHLKVVRELGLERRETVRSLSVVGVGDLRGAAPSTRGPEWTNLWCSGCHASGIAG